MWIRLPIDEASKLTASALIILAMLIDRREEREGNGYHTVQISGSDLSRLTGYSRMQVMRAIRELLDKGYITAHNRPGYAAVYQVDTLEDRKRGRKGKDKQQDIDIDQYNVVINKF